MVIKCTLSRPLYTCCSVMGIGKLYPTVPPVQQSIRDVIGLFCFFTFQGDLRQDNNAVTRQYRCHWGVKTDILTKNSSLFLSALYAVSIPIEIRETPSSVPFNLVPCLFSYISIL